MQCKIEKAFNVHNKIIVFFDKAISPVTEIVGKTVVGDIRILATENGKSTSKSAIVQTKILLEKLEGLQVEFQN